MLFLRLLYKLNLFTCLLYGALQVLKVDRLCGKVKGTIIHGLTYIAHFAVGTYHNHLQGRVVAILDFLEKRETVHLRHVDVGEYYIYIWMLQKHLHGFYTVVRKVKLIFTLANLSAEILG